MALSGGFLESAQTPLFTSHQPVFSLVPVPLLPAAASPRAGVAGPARNIRHSRPRPSCQTSLAPGLGVLIYKTECSHSAAGFRALDWTRLSWGLDTRLQEHRPSD